MSRLEWTGQRREDSAVGFLQWIGGIAVFLGVAYFTAVVLNLGEILGGIAGLVAVVIYASILRRRNGMPDA